MIRLILEAVKEWVESLLYDTLGLVPTFNTMPTDAELVSRLTSVAPLTSYNFRTKGYYAKNDGAGGMYRVSNEAIQGARRFVVENNTYYLVPTDIKTSERIDVCRLGIRPYTAERNGNVTVNDSFAERNSEYISNIYINGTPHDAVLVFPAGRFYFKNTINLKAFEISIEGVEPARARNEIATSGLFGGGTALCFPFLNDGESAIVQGDGNFRNVLIIGSKANYDFTIDRTLLKTNPSGVVTETIKQTNENTNFTNTGLRKTGSGYIENVNVMHFYRGILANAQNVYVDNVFAKKCHVGCTFGNDTKTNRLFGWNIHTLLQITGAITSVIQLRVDSCVHAVQISPISSSASIKGLTLVDIDGDWCTDSLIKIGNDENYVEVANSIFSNIHGRCNILKYYSASDTPPSASDLNTTNSEGYGIIRVSKYASFKNNMVSFNTIGNSNVEDSPTPTILTPPIMLTFSSGGNGVLGNIFKVASPLIKSTSDVAKVLQFGSENGTNARIETAYDTYYVKGSVVDSIRNTQHPN